MIRTIMDRKSVRSYDGNGLTDEELLELKEFASSIDSPFGVPVEFRFLDAAEHGLTSPVLTGVKTYVAGKVSVRPAADLSFGYAFEKLLLHAVSMELGTVWIAGTMDRKAFEKAMELNDGEIMPCMSPLGHPAPKRSMRETLMRKGVRADSRIEPDKLFFINDFENPVSEPLTGDMSECLETVRWAPSAVNKQPWRVVISGGSIHFFEHHDKGYVQPNGTDLQKVDLGIAICHFDLALEEKGISHEFIMEDPGLALPEDTEYIATFILK